MSWILFFDGDCAFCSASVHWVVRLDRRRQVFFAPLQGELAEKLELAGHAAEIGGTMVLLRESDGVIFTRSDAMVELARAMGWPWRIACVAAIIPRSWRDSVYQFIADHRRLYGKPSSCRMPDAELADRLRS